jgi:hypothetical protein
VTGKTVPELDPLTAPVVDSDVVAVYRSPGPLKRTTATVFADYIKAFFSAAGGSALVGFVQSGTAMPTRTLQDKNRDIVNVKDGGAVNSQVTDSLAAFNKAKTARASGGLINATNGYFTLSDTFTLNADRQSLAGEGGYATIIQFDPATAKSAIKVDNGGAGGTFNNNISGLGFQSGNSVTKTAIELVDFRHGTVTNIAISDGLWLGADSVGIRFRGRDVVDANNLYLACSRPVLLSPSPNTSTVGLDHFSLNQSELVGTSASYACLEIESGTALSNIEFGPNLALVKGKHGIYFNQTTGSVNSFDISISGMRTEQGLDATGWSIYLDAGDKFIDNLLIENTNLDTGRKGIFIRKARRVTMINVNLDTPSGAPKTVLDIVGVEGTVLIMQNCWTQSNAVVTITNMRRVDGIAPYVTAETLGQVEVWIYDDGTLANRKPRRLQGDIREDVIEFSIANTIQTNLSNMAGADQAHIEIALTGATKSMFGQVGYSPTSQTLIGGTSSTIEAGAYTGGKLAVIEASGVPSLINDSGETLTGFLKITWVV